MNSILDALLTASVPLVMLAAGAKGLARLRASRGEPWIDRLGALAAPIACVACFGFFVCRWLLSPEIWWSAVRIAPTIAWLRGSPLYAGPDAGPIQNNLYGPLGFLYLAPAGLASTPNGIVLIGTVLTSLAYFGPALWLHRVATADASPRWRALAFVTFGLLSLGMLALADSAFVIHVDAPALGLAAAATACVVGRRETPRARTLALSALLAACAVTTKQTTAPIVVALPLVLAIAHGLRAAALHAALALTWLAALAAAILAAFGAENTIFNMVTLPSRHPWIGGEWSFVTLFRLVPELADFLAWPAAVALGLALVDPVEGAGARERWRRRFQERPSIALLVVAAAMVPTSLLGRVKVGGYFNTLSPSLYFAALAACVELARCARADAVGRVVKALILSYATIASVGRAPLLSGIPGAVRALDQSPIQVAYDYARAHPDAVYLPWFPLSSLLADGKLYHFAYGVFDRWIARLPPTDAHFRAHMPARLDSVMFVSGQDEWVMTYLPEFTKRTKIPELPGWEILSKP